MMCYIITSFFVFNDTATSSIFFFFNDTATTEIYTLSLHDALPIYSLLTSASSLVGRVPINPVSLANVCLLRARSPVPCGPLAALGDRHRSQCRPNTFRPTRYLRPNPALLGHLSVSAKSTGASLSYQACLAAAPTHRTS